MDFFMKSEQYNGFKLPEYFTFDEVLKYASEKVIARKVYLQEGIATVSL